MAESSKRWLEPKDYLTITLSSLAFLISAASAYFNILRTVESVRLISTLEPLPTIVDDNTLVVRADSIGEAVFVNSGNRAALISSITFTYIQPPEAKEPDCPDHEGVNIQTDFEPTVLKSNDLFVRKFKLDQSWGSYQDSIKAIKAKDGSFSFPLAAHNKGKKDVLIDVCVRISVSTPSTSLHVTTLPVLRIHATEKAWYYRFTPNEGPLRMRPSLIISRTGTIFDN